jgi:hypothetical protein
LDAHLAAGGGAVGTVEPGEAERAGHANRTCARVRVSTGLGAATRLVDVEGTEGGCQ